MEKVGMVVVEVKAADAEGTDVLKADGNELYY